MGRSAISEIGIPSFNMDQYANCLLNFHTAKHIASYENLRYLRQLVGGARMPHLSTSSR